MPKTHVRQELLERRRARSTPERAEAAESIALHLLANAAVSRARRIACYLSMASEPGTGPTIEALVERGVEVIVPISLPDHTLDWVAYDPAAALATTSLGIPEPAGPRVGADALLSCDLVIVPALAVDHAGNRLGRGAGYYDRALQTVTAPICAVVFADELLPDVPHDDHDVPVQMAATPHGIFRTQQ